MNPQLSVGDFTVTAVNDGDVFLPGSYYPGLPAAVVADMVSSDGTYQIPIGCFLIQGRGAVMLVDAGLGPYAYDFPDEIARKHAITSPPPHIARGGRLGPGLLELGVSVEQVDHVILTHLHADHIGGVADEDGLTFPNAKIWTNAADFWAPLEDPAPGEAEGRERLDRAFASGAVHLLKEDEVEVVPGIEAHRIGGHTPGHTIVSVGATPEQVYLLGDSVHHPLQLVDRDVSFLLEHDPADALRAREELFTALTDSGVRLGMAHLPGQRFQTIESTSTGARQWVEV